jgi:hypothetical protein
MKDVDVDRLLRNASRAKDEAPAEMPYGFDTRVIALSRRNGNGAAFAMFVRRIAVVAAAVIVFATAGAWFEFNQNGDALEGISNEFAIAESAIQDEMTQ